MLIDVNRSVAGTDYGYVSGRGSGGGCCGSAGFRLGQGFGAGYKTMSGGGDYSGKGRAAGRGSGYGYEYGTGHGDGDGDGHHGDNGYG